MTCHTVTMIYDDAIKNKNYREAFHKLSPLKPCQLEKEMSVQNGSDRALYSIIPWWRRGCVVIFWEDYTWPVVSSEQYCYPSAVQSGVTLWGEPRPLSTSIGPGDINFLWHADMIANLLHRYSEGTGLGTGTSEGSAIMKFLWSRIAPFMSLGIKSLVQTAARAVPTYTQSMPTGTHFHSSSKSLYPNILAWSLMNIDKRNYLQNILLPIFPLAEHVTEVKV